MTVTSTQRVLYQSSVHFLFSCPNGRFPLPLQLPLARPRTRMARRRCKPNSIPALWSSVSPLIIHALTSSPLVFFSLPLDNAHEHAGDLTHDIMLNSKGQWHFDGALFSHPSEVAVCEGFHATVCQPHKVTTREHVHSCRWPFQAGFSPNFEDICATLLQNVGKNLLLVAHGHRLTMFQTRTTDIARDLGQRSSSPPNSRPFFYTPHRCLLPQALQETLADHSSDRCAAAVAPVSASVLARLPPPFG